MSAQPAFEVEIGDDGTVRVSGTAAVAMLWRLVLAAKFQTEPNAEHLLSPFVDRLIDELTRVAPVPPTDWNNPAILIPPELHEAVNAVRSYRELHEPEQALEPLVRRAMKPFRIPLDRLGLSSGETSA